MRRSAHVRHAAQLFLKLAEGLTLLECHALDVVFNLVDVLCVYFALAVIPSDASTLRWRIVFDWGSSFSGLATRRGCSLHGRPAHNLPRDLEVCLAWSILHHLEEGLVDSHFLLVHFLLNDVSHQHKLEEVELEALAVPIPPEAPLYARCALVLVKLLLVQLDC